MPISNFQDHEMSISNRNCELRTALFFGIHRPEPKSAFTFARARQHSRHSRFCANGRHNEVNIFSFARFSRCETTLFACGFQSCVSMFCREPSLNEARYGLRGFRVREASNPAGPQSRVRQRCGEEVAEDVLSSFRFELTLLESSDNDFLSRFAIGRHVIPRVGCQVPQTVVDSSVSRSSIHNGRSNLLA